MTHFATADELDDDGFFDAPARRASRAGRARGRRPSTRSCSCTPPTAPRCCATPARTSTWCAAGSPIYGMDPFGDDPAARGLEPALELSSYVAEVKLCAAGESAGYGRRFVAERDTYLGVLPIGYGDGWRRGLSNNADVLIGGAPPPAGGHGEHGQRHRRPRRRRRRASGCAASAAVLIGAQGERADHRRGGRAAAGHDQLRDHLRADRARAARLPPRRRSPPATPRERAPRARRAGMSDGLRGGPRGARRARARGWSAARCATRCSGATTADLDVVVDGDPAEAARAVAPRRRARGLLRAVGGVRRLARRRARRLLAGRRRAAARRLARGRPRAARLHRQRDRRAARGRRADRPARRRSRTCARGACAWPARAPSRDDPLRVLRLVRVAVELGLEPERRDAARGRARRRARLARRLRRAGVRGAAPDRRRAAARARARADGRARRHARSCCPSSRRCAASSRAASTTPTSTATRSRCSTARSS